MECFELYFWHCSCTVAHRCSGTVVHSDCSGTGTVALQWLQWRCIANCILHPGPAAAFTLMLKYQKCSALMLKYYHLLDYSTLLWWLTAQKCSDMILCSHLNRCCAKIVQRKRANVSLQCLWGKKSGADPETDKSSCPVRGCSTQLPLLKKASKQTHRVTGN